jgi:hypothetical protein
LLRNAQKLIRIRAKKCSLLNGVAPCTASELCYNTRGTCRDLANISEGFQYLWFCEPSQTLPQVPVTDLIFPVLQSVSTRPAELNPSFRFSDFDALGKRGELNITLSDFLHHDRGIDPYFDSRTREPQGTFWTRWLARNPYYAGFLVDVFDYIDGNSILEETYEIEKISNNSSGIVTIKALDVLRKGLERQAPDLSTAVILQNVNASQTTITVSDASQFGDSGVIEIGNELMDYTRSGSVLTVVRASYGTEAKTHSADDVVQDCLVYADAKVTDIIYDLLVNRGGVSADFIDLTTWQTDEELWMGGVRLSRVVAKPTKIKKLISEICEQTLAMIWFSQLDQKIKFRPIQPGITKTTLNDDENIVDSGVSINRDDEKRVNVVRVSFAKINPLLSDEPQNFSRATVTIASADVLARYGNELRYRDVFANWLPASQSAQAFILGSLILQESIDQLTATTFTLEYKDSDIDLGDVVVLNTRDLVDEDGAPVDQAALVVMREEVQKGLMYKYRVVLSQYANIRFGVISPDEFDFDLDAREGDYDGEDSTLDYDLDFLPPYSWPFWTAEERVKYVFLSDGDLPFFDGRLPYQLT